MGSKEVTCKRCGASWPPKSDKKPVQCARCHSILWDTEYKQRRPVTQPPPTEEENRQRRFHEIIQASGKTPEECCAMMGLEWVLFLPYHIGEKIASDGALNKMAQLLLPKP